MGAARLIELLFSRRNIGAVRTAEGEMSRRTYPAMVALHTTVIAGTLLLGKNHPRKPWLATLLLVQPLRLWVLTTLGTRWNARGAVPVEMTVETGGPYAHVRHPNYSVVAIELVSLPAAFGLGRLAIIATVVNAVLLSYRIRDEEALLFTLPGYSEHFASKPRFLPNPLRSDAEQ